MSDEHINGTTAANKTAGVCCPNCSARVGLLWAAGRSCLVELEGLSKNRAADGSELLVVRVHRCGPARGPGDDPTDPDGGAREPRGRPGECRGCKARIYWVQGVGHKWRPTNADGSSHFGTCPEANKFRGPKG